MKHSIKCFIFSLKLENQKIKMSIFCCCKNYIFQWKDASKTNKTFLNLSWKQSLFTGQLSIKFLPDVHVSQLEITDGVVDGKWGPDRWGNHLQWEVHLCPPMSHPAFILVPEAWPLVTFSFLKATWSTNSSKNVRQNKTGSSRHVTEVSKHFSCTCFSHSLIYSISRVTYEITLNT